MFAAESPFLLCNAMKVTLFRLPFTDFGISGSEMGKSLDIVRYERRSLELCRPHSHSSWLLKLEYGTFP